MNLKIFSFYLLLFFYILIFLIQLFKIHAPNLLHEEFNLRFQNIKFHKCLYLKQITSELLLQNHKRHSSSFPDYTIDILSISSKFTLELPHMQHKTFARHSSIRNFVIATEDDDPDPLCYKKKTKKDIENYALKCRSKKYWQKVKAHNLLTHNLQKLYARPEWLKTKNKLEGWFCAIKRQDYAFIKYMELLKESSIPLPNYIMIIDDDTYLNVDHLENYLLKTKDNPNVPRSTEPVIFAGCRVRHPVHEMKWTFPFGGWGIYLSEGALRKWMRSIHCEEKETEFTEICRLYTNSRKGDITIGEGKYFKKGMNLNEVFKSYLEEEVYCLHGDWFYGYIANFLNISSHVVPHNDLPTVGYGGSTAIWFDGSSKENPIDGVDQDFKEGRDAPENRLHTIMGSEIYNVPQGQCLYGNNVGNVNREEKEVHHYIPVQTNIRKGSRRGWKSSQNCIYNTTICHNVKDIETMKKLFHDAKLNNLQS